MARPQEYNEKVLEQTKDYLENFRVYGDVIPSVAGLALHLNKARSTVYEWRQHEDKQEFADILHNILSLQEKLLINNGLTGEFNSNITKLVLGKHGYTDKTDITSDDKPVPILNVLPDNSNKENKESQKED